MKLDLSQFDGATPGKWEPVIDWPHCCKVHGANSVLAQIVGDAPDTEANTRLMAAAPSLLAACLEMKQALEDLLDDMGNDGLCVCPAAKEQAIQALSRFTSEVEK